MKTSIFRRAAFALALALFATPALANAATGATGQPVHVTYATSIAPLVGYAYPWTGRLQLTLSPDNFITGYYRPAGNYDFIPVTGARDGKHIWLDIGKTGRIRIQGTLENGVITGSAFDERSNEPYKFSATLSK